jgi:hypothetical protein
LIFCFVIGIICLCASDTGKSKDFVGCNTKYKGLFTYWENIDKLFEEIDIPAPYERLEAWLANFEDEFAKWSPYHFECNLYDGNYQVGSKVRFREIVMGLDYDVTGTIRECEQDEDHFRIVFQSDKKTAYITFEGKRTKDGCHFAHTESFGMTTPVIGSIVNFLFFNIIYRKMCNW